MEPVVDFGLFEVLAASGLAWLGRKIYANRFAASGMLVVSVAAPAILVFIGSGELARWTAAVALGTALINAAVIFPLVRRGVVLADKQDA